MAELARLTGVGRTYPGASPVVALADVSMTIESSDYVAVVGPSGSGKSTLLSVLGLLDEPSFGSYFLDGYDTLRLSPVERAALRGLMVGFVFQDFHLTSYRTVLENVEMAGLYAGIPLSRRQRRAKEALEIVGLAGRSDFLPTQLSGGERQRVAIARALAGQAQMLLCDEPTGNLDSARGQEIIDLFETMNAQGHTIIVVTHDEHVAGRARRRFNVLDGQVTEAVPEKPVVEPPAVKRWPWE